jgi:succinoglycan biosynthesis transport protein ExoP
VPDTDFSLRHYLTILRRQAWLVVLPAAMSVAVAWFATSRQEPVYRASSKIVVGQSGQTFQAQLGSDVDRFTATMTNLLKSNIVAQTVISDLGLATTPEELLGSMDVVVRPNSSVLEVSYDASDRARLISVLDRIGAVFTDLVRTRLGGETAEPAPSGEVQDVLPVSATIFDPAHIEPGQVSPRPTRNLAIATALGLALGLVFAFARESLDNRIRSRRDAEEWFKAPVIGTLPKAARGRAPVELLSSSDRRSREVIDALHIIRANLQLGSAMSEGGVILVTSALPEEGKSTLVSSLGVVLAVSGNDVVCVEADLRRPKLMDYLGVEPYENGLVEVIEGRLDVEDALQTIEIGRVASPNAGLRRGASQRQRQPVSAAGLLDETEPRGAGRLQLLPAGRARVNATMILTPEHVRELLDSLRQPGRFVIFDAPPLLLVADALPLALEADSVIVVARQGRTTRENAEAVRGTLESLGAANVSLVISDSSGGEGYGAGYGYGYYTATS